MSSEREPRDDEGPADGDSFIIEVRAYSLPARLAGVGLQAIAAANILYLAFHMVSDFIEGAQSAPPLIVAMGVTLFSGVPLTLVELLRRLLAATAEVEPANLVLVLRRARFEIPLASITAIRPWRLPLPGPGLSLEMKSDNLFRYRLELADPGALISTMGDRLSLAESASGHATVAYARARQLRSRRVWLHAFLKFGFFPLVLTMIVFRLHQYIVYGGPFGEYHLLGLASYLKSFAAMFAGTVGQLLVYAGTIRLVAEALALLFTAALPSRAGAVRRFTEVFCALAYFALVPADLLYRLSR